MHHILGATSRHPACATKTCPQGRIRQADRILQALIHFSPARSNPVPNRRHRWPGLQELASVPTRPFADQRGAEKSMGARISFGTDFTRATSVPCRTTPSPPTPPRGGFAAYDIQRTSLTLRASSLSGQFQDIGFPALHMQPSGEFNDLSPVKCRGDVASCPVREDEPIERYLDGIEPDVQIRNPSDRMRHPAYP